MKKSFKDKKKEWKNKKGFTLVEALISITILMISVAAPLNLASKGLIAADIAQRQIVAFYLAQDATEWIIYKKASNKLDEGSFNDFLDNNVDDCVISETGDYGCAINSSDEYISKCSSEDCSQGKLYKENGTGKYTLSGSGNIDTGFIRYVKITPIGIPPYISAKIETTVKWKSVNGKEQKYILKNILTY